MEIPRIVYQNDDITDAECRVLGVLLTFIPWKRPGQIAFVAPKQLTSLSGKSRATVYRALANLVERGILERAETDNGYPGFKLTGSLTGETVCLTGETDNALVRQGSLTSETPNLTSETGVSHQRESQHYMNHELNHELNKSAKAPTSHPTQLDLDGHDDPEMITERSQPLAPLWARHEALRNEAKVQCGKRTRTNKLSLTVRKMLTALLKAGHEEEEMIAAWSQARNEAITKQDMRWFNGATELVPKKVVQLAGMYHGETVDDAREARRHIIGGNKGWGVAIVAESESLSQEHRDKESERARRKDAHEAECSRLQYDQAQDILKPYGISDWRDYMVKWDSVSSDDHKRIENLPEIQAPDPESEHYD